MSYLNTVSAPPAPIEYRKSKIGKPYETRDGIVVEGPNKPYRFVNPPPISGHPQIDSAMNGGHYLTRHEMARGGIGLPDKVKKELARQLTAYDEAKKKDARNRMMRLLEQQNFDKGLDENGNPRVGQNDDYNDMDEFHDGGSRGSGGGGASQFTGSTMTEPEEARRAMYAQYARGFTQLQPEAQAEIVREAGLGGSEFASTPSRPAETSGLMYTAVGGATARRGSRDEELLRTPPRPEAVARAIHFGTTPSVAIRTPTQGEQIVPASLLRQTALQDAHNALYQRLLVTHPEIVLSHGITPGGRGMRLSDLEDTPASEGTNSSSGLPLSFGTLRQSQIATPAIGSPIPTVTARRPRPRVAPIREQYSATQYRGLVDDLRANPASWSGVTDEGVTALSQYFGISAPTTPSGRRINKSYLKSMVYDRVLGYHRSDGARGR